MPGQRLRQAVLRGHAQDRGDGLRKVRHCKLRVGAQRLAVTALNQHRAASGAVRAIDIPPAVANDEAARKIEIVGGGSPKQHPRFWFSTITGVAVPGARVVANLDGVEAGNGPPQCFVHGLNHFSRLGPASYVWLVAYYNEDEARFLQTGATFDYALLQFEFLERGWRKWHTVANYRPIQDSIAVEKNSAALFYFVVSHFVCAALSAG